MKPFDPRYIPSRTNRFAAHELARLANSPNLTQAKNQLSEIQHHGYSMGWALAQVVELQGERQTLENLEIYVNLLGKRGTQDAIDACLAHGHTQIAIGLLKIRDRIERRNLYSKHSEEVLRATIHAERLLPYLSKFGFKSLLTLLVDLRENQVDVWQGKHLLLAEHFSELNDVEFVHDISALMNTGVSLLLTDDVIDVTRLQSRDLSSWMSMQYLFESSLDRFKFDLAVVNHRKDSKLLQQTLLGAFGDEDVFFPESLRLLSSWIQTNTPPESVEEFQDAYVAAFGEKARTKVILSIVIYLVRQGRSEIAYAYYNRIKKSVIQSVVDKDNSQNDLEAKQKQAESIFRSQRRTSFSDFNWCLTLIENFYDDQETLVSILKVAFNTGYRYQFEIALTYLSENYLSALTPNILLLLDEEIVRLDTYHLHTVLKNMTSPQHWVSVATAFPHLLNSHNMQTGIELAVRTRNLDLTTYLQEHLSDDEMKARLKRRLVFQDVLISRDIEAAVEMTYQRFKNEGTSLPDLMYLIRSASTPDYPKILDLLVKIVEDGAKLDSLVYCTFLARYLKRGEYDQILKSQDKVNLPLNPQFAPVFLYELTALLELDLQDRAHVLHRDVTALELTEEFYEELEYIRSFKITQKSIERLNSMTFEFPTPNPERVVRRRTLSDGPVQDRNRSLALELKDLYDNRCQVCAERISTPFGFISQAAHIQGLGHPHWGPDVLGNLLILCPNHHASFDSAGWYLTNKLLIIDTVTGSELGKLSVHDKHQLLTSCLDYQRNYRLKALSMKKRNWLNSANQ